MGRHVTVVIVTWNSARFLRRCLDGIAGQTHAEIEVVQVDNASSDGSAEIVRARFPDCARIINETNRGFAAAANQGIRAARGEFVLLCNPDAFLGPEYAARLASALDEAGEPFGMATGKLMRALGDEIEPLDAIDSMGVRMTRTGRHLDIDGEPALSRLSTPEPPERRRYTEVFGVSGAAGMYTKSFINTVSINDEFFDEDFFAYREDADVAWRGQLFGWKALYVPEAVAWHVRRVTPAARRSLPPEINMHSVKNRFLLRLKNEGAYLALRNAPFELFRDAVTIGAVLTLERSSLPALSWLWRNRRRILEKRRAVQRRRRVSDRELARWFR